MKIKAKKTRENFIRKMLRRRKAQETAGKPNGIIKALNLHRERYETLSEGCHFREGGIIR